jgi:hypothetical protein
LRYFRLIRPGNKPIRDDEQAQFQGA